MYSLKKIKLLEGKDSKVYEGTESVLPHVKLYKNSEFRAIDSLKDLEEDGQVVLHSPTNYHRTSPIQRLVEVTDDKAVFETMTSVYELTKLQTE